jgi:hypothetical protein
MPTFERGQMWNAYYKSDAFCITTNSYIRNDGNLVMGRGIARTARDVIDGIDKKFGNRIRNRCGHLGTYGLLPADPKSSRMVAFQVKTHFKNSADTDLIQQSAEKLRTVAIQNSNRRFDLNYPGIGAGRLNLKKVKPIVSELPKNVHVWRFSKE